jgi:hypothetical protein
VGGLTSLPRLKDTTIINARAAERAIAPPSAVAPLIVESVSWSLEEEEENIYRKNFGNFLADFLTQLWLMRPRHCPPRVAARARGMQASSLGNCTCLGLLGMLVAVDAFIVTPTLPSVLRRGAAGVKGPGGLETATNSLKNICRQSLGGGRGLAMTSDPSESPKSRDSCPAIIVGDIHMIAPGERRYETLRTSLRAAAHPNACDNTATTTLPYHFPH